MYEIKSVLPQRSPSVTHWDITLVSTPSTRHGDSPPHFFFCPDASRGTTNALLHHWALLGTVPLMQTGDGRAGGSGTISSYCSLSEGSEQQRDSAHPSWAPSPHRAQPATYNVPLYPKTWTAVHHKICNSWTVDAWGPKTLLNLFLCSTKSWRRKGIVKCFQNDHCFFC